MRTWILGLSLAALAFPAEPAAAGGPSVPACGAVDRCGDCGCRARCERKVCQIVCGTRIDKKYCFVVECEDFCPLLPGCKDGPHHCGKCADCAAGNACAAVDCAKKPCDCGKCQQCMTPPRCGHPRTRKILIRKEYEVEVPIYKCVVRYLCGDCTAACDANGTAVKAQAPLPPAPPVAPLPAAPSPR